jgi:hypothetical protein
MFDPKFHSLHRHKRPPGAIAPAIMTLPDSADALQVDRRSAAAGFQLSRKVAGTSLAFSPTALS